MRRCATTGDETFKINVQQFNEAIGTPVIPRSLDLVLIHSSASGSTAAAKVLRIQCKEPDIDFFVWT